MRNSGCRLLRVDEPDASGALIETARYNYDLMGRLTTVQMGRTTAQPQNASLESGLTGWTSYTKRERSTTGG